MALGPRTASAKGRLVVSYRHHPDQVDDRKRELAEAKIADFIAKALAAAPPLTDKQLTDLAELLRPVRVTGRGAPVADEQTDPVSAEQSEAS
jgi:hypothetical protein